MKLSEFQLAVRDEFGDSYSSVVLADLVLPALDGRTAEQALTAGVPPREVWLALCDVTDIPRQRRYGVGRPAPLR